MFTSSSSSLLPHTGKEEDPGYYRLVEQTGATAVSTEHTGAAEPHLSAIKEVVLPHCPLQSTLVLQNHICLL